MAQPNLDSPERIHIRVTGRVQGVGFRSFVEETATRSGLTGWVRNLGYDQVEVLAEGPHQNLERFVEQVKIGPTGGRVDEALVEWESGTGEFSSFVVRSSR